jgi:hypothetical protein
MKIKRSFTFLIILTCLAASFFTCNLFHGGGEGEREIEYEYTDVVYSEDGKSVTIYLEGQVYAPRVRALTTNIAKMGCDYFEVTFLYNDALNNKKVTRGEWAAGKMAGISGLEKGGTAGINYGGISATLGPNAGSAILFAGKSDKTLMAIGRLTAVDGNGTPTARQTIITDTTKSVTFTISAINAGVRATATGGAATVEGRPATATADSIVSSFVTNYLNTDESPSSARTTVFLNNGVFGSVPALSSVYFPIFKLHPARPVLGTKALYTFRLSSEGTAGYNFSDYASPGRGNNNAIFISTPAFGNTIPGLPPNPADAVPAEIDRKQPRYTTYDNRGQPTNSYHNSILMLDESTIIYLTNNNIPEQPFDPAVSFTFFNKDTVDGSVFALVFSIPVYALQEYESSVGGVGAGIKSRWYIRPGYGPSLYDLDDGTLGMGGAVLIGTGSVNKTDTGDRVLRIPGRELENGGVDGLPDTWRYTADTANGANNGTIFNINGLIVQLVGTGNNPEVFIEGIKYADLTFKIGTNDIVGRNAQWTTNPALGYTSPPNDTSKPFYRFPPEFYGLIEVTVEYYDNEKDRILKTSFYVMVGNAQHPFQNIFNIAHIYDHNRTYPPAKPAAGALAAWQLADGGNNLNSFSNSDEKFRNLVSWGGVIRDRTTVIILHNSFDRVGDAIVNATVTEFANFMVIAADDDRLDNNTRTDIILGRAGGGNLGSSRIVHSGGVSPGLNAWYFGRWPFKSAPPGSTWPGFPFDNGVNYSKSFTVNTGGGYWATGTNPPVLPADWRNPTTSWKFMTDSNQSAAASVPGGGIYNVKVNDAVIYPTNSDADVAGGFAKYPLLH